MSDLFVGQNVTEFPQSYPLAGPSSLSAGHLIDAVGAGGVN